MILDSKCVHWWIIGDYSVGHCKKCGAVRDFEQLRQEEKTHMNILREKRKGLSSAKSEQPSHY
jgi:hypothetical protein